MDVSILLHLRANKHVHVVPAHSRTKQEIGEKKRKESARAFLAVLCQIQGVQLLIVGQVLNSFKPRQKHSRSEFGDFEHILERKCHAGRRTKFAPGKSL